MNVEAGDDNEPAVYQLSKFGVGLFVVGDLVGDGEALSPIPPSGIVWLLIASQHWSNNSP